jgi:hypothetical protein
LEPGFLIGFRPCLIVSSAEPARFRILMLVQPDGNSFVERTVAEARFRRDNRRLSLALSQLDTLPAKTGALILRRQKHAHRQFLTAIHTLAIVRRLQPGVIGWSA